MSQYAAATSRTILNASGCYVYQQVWH